MSQFVNVERFEAGLEQVRDTARRLDERARDAQQQWRARGDAWAQEVQQRTEEGLREARSRAEALREELTERAERAWTESRVAQRVSALRDGAIARLREGLDRAVDALPVASQQEVERVNRKLANLQRKLRKIEKAQD